MKNNRQQYRYCGRDFSGEELEKIREIITSDERLNRVKISRRVCEVFGWYRRDGGLKEMSCRVALLRMERDGLIRLPPPRVGGWALNNEELLPDVYRISTRYFSQDSIYGRSCLLISGVLHG